MMGVGDVCLSGHHVDLIDHSRTRLVRRHTYLHDNTHTHTHRHTLEATKSICNQGRMEEDVEEGK